MSLDLPQRRWITWDMKYLVPVFCLITTLCSAQAGENLLVNGDFEKADQQWLDVGKHDRSEITDDSGNNVLTLKLADSSISVTVSQEVPVKGGQMLRISGQVRVRSIQPGQAEWHNARIQLTWKDAEGNSVTPWPPSPGF